MYFSRLLTTMSALLLRSSRPAVTSALARSASSAPSAKEGGASVKESMVLVSVKNGVATLTMNNARKLNGWTLDMMEALKAAMAAVAKDANVKAAVLTGKDPYYRQATLGLVLEIPCVRYNSNTESQDICYAHLFNTQSLQCRLLTTFPGVKDLLSFSRFRSINVNLKVY